MARLFVSPDALDDSVPARSALSVVAHGRGWAVKYKDSYLGTVASLPDALHLLRALSDNAPRSGA
jgi:hypothetical protein